MSAVFLLSIDTKTLLVTRWRNSPAGKVRFVEQAQLTSQRDDPLGDLEAFRKNGLPKEDAA